MVAAHTLAGHYGGLPFNIRIWVSWVKDLSLQLWDDWDCGSRTQDMFLILASCFLRLKGDWDCGSQTSKDSEQIGNVVPTPQDSGQIWIVALTRHRLRADWNCGSQTSKDSEPIRLVALTLQTQSRSGSRDFGSHTSKDSEQVSVVALNLQTQSRFESWLSVFKLRSELNFGSHSSDSG